MDQRKISAEGERVDLSEVPLIKLERLIVLLRFSLFSVLVYFFMCVAPSPRCAALLFIYFYIIVYIVHVVCIVYIVYILQANDGFWCKVVSGIIVFSRLEVLVL